MASNAPPSRKRSKPLAPLSPKCTAAISGGQSGARGKRAGDAVRHGVELGIADLARELAAEVDDRDLVEIAIAADEVPEVGERGHGNMVISASRRRKA